MSSIGNDIVALDNIDIQRTGEYRFYSKILSPSEQELYHLPRFAVIPFHIYVWLLWSAKESVYKLLKRHQPKLVFSPSQIVITQLLFEPELLSEMIFLEFKTILNDNCELKGLGFHSCSSKFQQFPNSANSGSELLTIHLHVSYQENIYYCRSMVFQQLIATFANHISDFGNIYWGIKNIASTNDEHQSAEVRAFLLENLKQIIPDADLSIMKSPEGYPIVLDGANKTGFKVSFAHHGSYVAYAFKA